MAKPFWPSNPSGHQPSRMEQFTPRCIGGFMPLVPLASWGRMGVLSHTSAPEVSSRPTRMSYSSSTTTLPMNSGRRDILKIFWAKACPSASRGWAFPAKINCTGRSGLFRIASPTIRWVLGVPEDQWGSGMSSSSKTLVGGRSGRALQRWRSKPPGKTDGSSASSCRTCPAARTSLGPMRGRWPLLARHGSFANEDRTKRGLGVDCGAPMLLRDPLWWPSSIAAVRGWPCSGRA